jgi:glutamate/tyrosine decarboxylase-like PLP-dependent enzyme
METRMSAKLPEVGRSADELMESLRSYAAGDADWRHGRVPAFVFRGGTDDVSEVGKAAYSLYFSENALGAKRAFPSVKRMEQEIVEIGLDLFHAPADATGYFSTGGTESILMAVKACRDFERVRRGTARHRGNLVLAETAHPAFTKAAMLMDLEIRRTPTGADFRADPAAMAAAIDDDTILMVGSAPCFPRGVIDPIAELSELALRRDIWLHIDACVGGYLAPFAHDIGYPIPDFDFALPGVRSLSADLHKYGFCPKPASTIFFRDAERARCAMFEIDEWPSGLYAVATIVGTRPGGAVAGAWATLNYLGRSGYCREARRLMAMRERYITAIEAIPGFHIWGKPDLTLLSFGCRRAEPKRIAEGMIRRGWVPGLTRDPAGLHVMLTLIHDEACADYARDLAASADEAAATTNVAPAVQVSVTYG